MALTKLELMRKLIQYKPLVFTGCVRRNVWHRPKLSESGAAVLHSVADEVCDITAGGYTQTVYLSEDNSLYRPLLWYGGPFKDWMVDDALIVHGMVISEGEDGLPKSLQTVVLHELDGTVQVRYIECHQSVQRYKKLLDEWTANVYPPRIDVSSERARFMCPKCPIRVRCLSTDITVGEEQNVQTDYRRSK